MANSETFERIGCVIEEIRRVRADAARLVEQLRRDVEASRERADKAVRVLRKAGLL